MTHPATTLLYSLIAHPSVSRNEAETADEIEQWLKSFGVTPLRIYNNVWAISDNYDPSLPTLMLNSHHDTVKPSATYTFDPFKPHSRDGKIYGLGSNDAGASVVSLAWTFVNIRHKQAGYNTVLALTAEEEVMGEHGMRAMLPELERNGIKIDMAIVGEPTGMECAVGERGLVVMDCTAHGVAGHAARNEGVNAIYRAIEDINRLRNLSFERTSDLLGPVGISVTQISAGRQHNVIPDECSFVADIRTTDAYSNEEIVEIVKAAIESEATPRSTRVRASAIGCDHPLVRSTTLCGRKTFVSPTTSDMALMPFPSIKIGPGDSTRSHSADEFILESEIAEALELYPRILENLSTTVNQKT